MIWSTSKKRFIPRERMLKLSYGFFCVFSQHLWEEWTVCVATPLFWFLTMVGNNLQEERDCAPLEFSIKYILDSLISVPQLISIRSHPDILELNCFFLHLFVAPLSFLKNGHMQLQHYPIFQSVFRIKNTPYQLVQVLIAKYCLRLSLGQMRRWSERYGDTAVNRLYQNVFRFA